MTEFYQKSKVLRHSLTTLLGVILLIALCYQNAQAQTYCTTSVATNGNIYYTDSVKTTGGITNINHLNNNPIVVNSTGYTDQTAQVVSATQGSSFQLLLHGRQLYQYHWNVFIDWNQNGTLDDAGEVVYSYLSGTQIQTATVTVNIPAGAIPGNTRMRVGMYRISTTTDPCYVGTAVMGYITDFTVNVISLSPCTNPVVAGAATKSPVGQTCPGSNINLGLSGITLAAGQTYEWESSPDNITYTSIAAASINPGTTVAPLATTWYRCKVVCSGGTPAYSTPVQATVATGLSGTYTVNSAAPSAGTNFNNFTDLAAALNCGIVAPVTVNVVPGSGPYNETFNLNNIGGTSATNTIRINGNGATIQFANTAANLQLLSLNGTKYIRIDSLKFKTLDATYGWGALITGGAANDSITNCQFDLSSLTTTTAANANGIVFSGSNTSPTTAGANAANCYIANNLFTGGGASGGYYYAVTLTSGADSNIIENNKFLDYYFYGAYLSAAKYNVIRNNEFSRPTKTAVTTFYGVYTTGATEGTRIESNRIHTPGGTVSNATNSAYGIYLTGTGTAAAPRIIANNAVYKMNTGGTSYGIYLSSATNTKILHNTIVYDQIQTGTTAQSAIYLLGTNTGLEIINNSISFTGGNTGVKYGFNYTTAVSLTSIANAQRNNVYMNSIQTGAQWHSASPTATTYATLAAFQAANPTLEIGSVSVDPQFTNPAAGNFLPMNLALQGNGLNLGTAVTTDITGMLRGTLPSPGAWEIPAVSGPDGGVLALISPTGNFCANQQSVKVSVINSGSLPLTNFQVHWTLNGSPQSPYSYTGTLPIFGQGQHIDTVTLGTPNLPAGNNTIKAWTVVTNDVNNANDTLTVVVTPVSFTVSTASDTVCSGSDATLNLSPAVGYAAGIIQWQESTNGTTFTNITGATSASYTATNLTANRWYRAFINSGTGGCYSNVESIVVLNPLITGTTPGSRCGTGAIQLAATGGVGTDIKWYATATGGTPIGTSSSFTTPSISATTTYYAEAVSGGGAADVASPTIGTSVYWNASVGWGLRFTVNTPVTIDSVTIKAQQSTSPGAASIQILVTDLSDVILYSGVMHTFNITATATEYRIPVNISLPPGDYKMVKSLTSTTSGINNMVRESSGVSFPYASPGNEVVITAGANGTGTAQTTSAYYWFYNWKISSGCAGPRVPVIATVTAPPSVSGTGASRCGTGTVTLSATSTTAGATFNWYTTPTGGSPVFTGASYTTPSITTTTTYYVTANTIGCESDRSPVIATVNPLPVATGTGASRCGTGTLTLTASSATVGAIFNWYANAIGGTALFTGASFTTPSIATTTTYYVEATGGTCIGTRIPVVATVNSLPTVTLGNDTAYCAGSSVTLHATSTATSFLWDNASTAASRTVNAAGTYHVQVTDLNNCTAHDTILVTENALPVVNLGNDTAICDGDAVTLNAGSTGTNYIWDDASTNQTRTATTAGQYFVVVTDANGCVGTDTLVITLVPLPSGDFTATEGSGGTVSFTATSNNATIYSWDFGDGNSGTGSQVNHPYGSNGSFIVTLSLINECGDTVKIQKEVRVTTLSINKLVDDKSIIIYPNPTKTNLTVENMGDNKMESIVISDALGRSIRTIFGGTQKKVTIDVSALSSGVYNVTIQTKNGRTVRKFTISQ